MISVNKKLERFRKGQVCTPTKLENVPKHAKILSSTWAMKKKSIGTNRVRMNMRGYEQIDGEHYDSASISSPVRKDVSVRVLLILLVMADYGAYIVDIGV